MKPTHCKICGEEYIAGAMGFEGGVYAQDVLKHERIHKEAGN